MGVAGALGGGGGSGSLAMMYPDLYASMKVEVTPSSQPVE